MRRPASFGIRSGRRRIGIVSALGLTAALAAGPWILSAQSATPTIERVSVADSEAERNVAPGGSTVACSSLTARRCTKRTISDDGTRVVYSSKAENLVDGDTNGHADVFLTTMSPGTLPVPGATPTAPYTGGAPPSVTSTVRVSVGPGGAEGNADSAGPSISPDGHWVAFESAASNLLPAGGDPNGDVVDVFVYHVDDQSLRLASVPASGSKGGDGASFSASVSNTGTVSFTSLAGNMVAGASGQQVYAREDPAGAAPKTEIMSAAAANGPAGAGKSGESTISADGTKVAFTSNATNIGSDDSAHTDDVFVRTIGSSYSMSQLSTGAGAYLPSISPAGDKVAFLADGIDTDHHTDVYTAIADGGQPTIIGNCSCSAGTLDTDAGFATMSTSGSVAFSSAAPYTKSLRYLNPQVFQIVKGMTPVSAPGGIPARARADLPSLSADGTLVAFESAADNLVGNDFNESPDVFVAQMGEQGNGREALSIIRVSVYATGTTRREASGSASSPTAPAAVSSDGNLVAFTSDSSNLVPGDTNGVSDIFVRNRAAGTTERVSVANGGGQADGASITPAMSADGRYVVFASAATNLIDGDTNGVADIFLRDRQTGETRRISEKPNAGQQPVPAQHPSISPNGQYIAFDSGGDFDPALPPFGNGRPNVFRYHADTGAIEMVSTWVPPSQPGSPRQAGFKPSFEPSVADDGSVAFLSDGFGMTASGADEPVPANPNWTDVYVGRPDGTIVKASMNNDRTPVPAVGDSSEPRISADGTHVAFVVNGSSDLPQTGADQNPSTDVYVRDLVAKTTVAVDVPSDKSAPTGHNYSPAINADGSAVAFVSDATNLVPGDSNAVADVFVVNLASGGISRVEADGGQPNGASFMPAFSLDGQSLVFASSASNLVAGDGNGAFDWFIRGLTGVPVPVPCTTCAPGGGGSGSVHASGPGYRFVAADGGIFSFDQPFFGSTGNIHLNKPIVGTAATPTNLGYWLVASDGGLFSFGDAAFLGSTGAIRLNSPVVGMAATPSGKGYWFVAADGGIFAFGDAAFYGSTGNNLNKPIVGMAATRSGKGYWLVAADGGIFSFGDAGFYGSTGNIKLAKPIVGMDRTASGNGYRFVAADGGIFSFGDASFLGSMGGKPLGRPVVGMARARSGDGYWLVASDGGVFSFGSAGFHGSTGAQKLNSPIVGMAG